MRHAYRMKLMRQSQAYFDAKHMGYDQFADVLMDEFKAKTYEVDCALQSLFAYIQRQSWSQDAHIILTADHGTCYTTKNKPLLMERKVKIPLRILGPGIPSTKESHLIGGSVDLMPSVLKLAGLTSPQQIAGQIWPFLGGTPRQEVFTESLYREYYEATVRDEQFSYHFRYPYNEATGHIDFRHLDQLIVYARQQGRDIETVLTAGRYSQKEATERLLKYHGSPRLEESI
jgi:arylsulfatase A-like enzyme